MRVWIDGDASYRRQVCRQPPGGAGSTKSKILGQNGDTLGDYAFRRVDQLNRMLRVSKLAVQQLVLKRVLSVVAGITLVGNQGREIVRVNRQIGVDIDPGLAVAQIPVVSTPGLIGHERNFYRISLREIDELTCVVSSLRQNHVDQPGRSPLINREPGTIGNLPLADRSIARQTDVELQDRFVEYGIVCVRY